MGNIKKLQVVLVLVATVVFLLAILTKLHVLPNHLFLVTTGGLHRITNTLLLFSVAVGLLWLVYKKQCD